MTEQNSSSRGLSLPRLRFSIRSLLMATTVVAAMFPLAWFAWFLLMNSSTAWASAAFWVTASILAVAVMIAVNRQGSARAYWTGFAVVGLIYFFLVPCDLPSDSRYMIYFDHESLPTARLTRFVYFEYVYPRLIGGQPAFGATFTLGPGRPGGDDFIMVAELLWTLLFAFIGGWISLLIWATRPPATPERVP
jgi:hypothetical protein